jgi:hypothetical protein
VQPSTVAAYDDPAPSAQIVELLEFIYTQQWTLKMKNDQKLLCTTWL